jgi:hypothetical protein
MIAVMDALGRLTRALTLCLDCGALMVGCAYRVAMAT